MEDLVYPSADGRHTVHACIWRPEGRAIGVLQIIHGMAEYAARYSRFAEEAASRGYLVCAEDHLGHGKTAEEGELGHIPERGEEIILSDIAALTDMAEEMAPLVPVYIMGHSMGSFFCREYIARCGNRFSAAVVMGTGYTGRGMLSAGLLLTRSVSRMKGCTYKSPFLKKLVFGSYNKKFGPAATGYEWLSANEDNVERYVKDELCGFGFTCGGYAALFNILKKCCSSSAFKNTDKALPVLLVSGENDPVGGYGKGVKKVYRKYLKSGHKETACTLYAGARHEILNESCAGAVKEDIFAFLEANAHMRS